MGRPTPPPAIRKSIFTWATARARFTGGANYTAPNSGNFNPGPNSIVAEDVNGDGKLDLVAMTPYNGVFVFLGNGDGTFQTPVPNTTVCTGAIGNCGSLAVGDLNGDGKPDLALQSDDTTGGGISILLNTGNGTFGTATYYPVAISGIFAGAGIAIGDVNGDKKPDVVVGSSSVTAIVYLNQGSGTFKVNGTVGSVALNPTNNVVLADINNDKKLDIVVPDGLGDVFTFYGKGNGTFTTGPGIPAPGLQRLRQFSRRGSAISTATVRSTCWRPTASVPPRYPWAVAMELSRPASFTPTAVFQRTIS